uniref:T-cell receptor alpha chain constant domain-containing protein n=2 Tax=Scleropages formosus TaxID=113540 RepID=A0A8C9STY9_SCLFO
SGIVPALIAVTQCFCCAPSDCVNDGSWKVVFGRGTKLLVESRTPSDPSYYLLEKDSTQACLATGFSAYNATDKEPLFNQTKSSPTRIEHEATFDKVVLVQNATDCPSGKGSASGECATEGFFETDEKINFLSLTILGLRVLFLKSVVFNVIMTLRVWMS